MALRQTARYVTFSLPADRTKLLPTAMRGMSDVVSEANPSGSRSHGMSSTGPPNEPQSPATRCKSQWTCGVAPRREECASPQRRKSNANAPRARRIARATRVLAEGCGGRSAIKRLAASRVSTTEHVRPNSAASIDAGRGPRASRRTARSAGDDPHHCPRARTGNRWTRSSAG